MERLVLLVIAYLSILVPPVVRADRIDDYIEARMRREHIPGLSLAIVQNGKVVRAKGYGFADLENRVRATPDTVFRLASLSKQFTATAILRLVEEEKIGLDESITRYLNGAPDAWKPITLRHLLTHTSGLSDVDGIPGFSFRKDYTSEEFLREMGRLPLDSAPGSRLVYCSSGYHLLGLIIEKVSGKSYEEFLQERFFQPFKMTSTGAWSVQKVVPNRAAGYEWENNGFLKSEYLRPRITAPGGGVLSSVRDLAAWDLALQAQKPLRADSLAQMTTPALLRGGSVTTAGFGWFMTDQRGHKLVQHNGATNGFSTTIDRYVDDRLTVIVLCNRAGVDAEGIARRLAGMVRPELLPAEALPEATQDNDPQITQTLRRVLAAVAENRPSRALNPAYNRLLSAEDRKAESERLKGDAALAFLVEDDVRGRTLKRLGLPIARLRHYRLKTGGKTFRYTFWLTPEGMVAEYEAQEVEEGILPLSTASSGAPPDVWLPSAWRGHL